MYVFCMMVYNIYIQTTTVCVFDYIDTMFNVCVCESSTVYQTPHVCSSKYSHFIYTNTT
jgi:hypothetical protein